MNSDRTLALSVLDLVPVRTGQTSAQAVVATLEVASTADKLGYRRYWFAEHHNMPAVASTTPPVLAAAVAARTEQIRVGSGGVMLPNHSTLIVAEQFAALAAIAPGRIDLGLGRAPGSDPVISQLLHQSGTAPGAETFPQQVREITALLDPAGAGVRLRGGEGYAVRSTPVAVAGEIPQVWLLGSSDFSAKLAAELGLPYVFANHFGGPGLSDTLATYRDTYQPSEAFPEPRTILTVNASVAPTAEEAAERMLPQRRTMARLRTGLPMTAQETVEEAQATPLPGPAESYATKSGSTDPDRLKEVVDTPDNALEQLTAFAGRYGVDEVMIAPVAGAYDGEPIDRAPGAEQTVRLLGEALG
ncbi:LLM class flavin-dependent oxidoreductase [Corynebacterium variabile]|uniref:LLM class flavin-dependent oxidoreductase n=1 Tax=Corynebacterium variabile TaxID=1727 RepID=UPI0028AED7C4|nr:LLM class flavin-dependent oxidoreductase [Corynebacterium variabile]